MRTRGDLIAALSEFRDGHAPPGDVVDAILEAVRAEFGLVSVRRAAEAEGVRLDAMPRTDVPDLGAHPYAKTAAAMVWLDEKALDALVHARKTDDDIDRSVAAGEVIRCAAVVLNQYEGK